MRGIEEVKISKEEQGCRVEIRGEKIERWLAYGLKNFSYGYPTTFNIFLALRYLNYYIMKINIIIITLERFP